MRCPFKLKEFSDPERQQCEEDCALLVDNFCSSDEPRGVCAITLLGVGVSDVVRVVFPDYGEDTQHIWFPHNSMRL